MRISDGVQSCALPISSMESPAHANDECVPQNLPHSRRLSMASTPDNDNNLEGPMVFIIISKAYEIKAGEGIDLHIILRPPDEESEYRRRGKGDFRTFRSGWSQDH